MVSEMGFEPTPSSYPEDTEDEQIIYVQLSQNINSDEDDEEYSTTCSVNETGPQMESIYDLIWFITEKVKTNRDKSEIDKINDPSTQSHSVDTENEEMMCIRLLENINSDENIDPQTEPTYVPNIRIEYSLNMRNRKLFSEEKDLHERDEKTSQTGPNNTYYKRS